MEYWTRNRDSERFETREDAYEDYLINEDSARLIECIYFYLGYDRLLSWAMEQEGFWSYFYDEITEAQEECFAESYTCHDSPDDEEEA